MKNHRYILVIVFLLHSSLTAFAQNSTGKAFLQIGDKVPDLIFPIKNYKAKTARISDFKGKLIILDLWATTCGSCIAAMPKMEYLQKKFDGKVQIIMVTKDNDATISKSAQRIDNIRNNKLPSVTNDKILATKFNYTFLPTHIWIDQSGTVKFITSGTGANEKNIQDFLDGKAIILDEKIDLDLNREQPMMVRWYPYYKGLTISMFLAPTNKKYHTGSIMGQTRTKDGFINKVFNDHSSVSGLYKLAFGLGSNSNQFSENRVIFKSKDSLKYKYDPKLDYRDPKAGLTYMFELLNNTRSTDKKIYQYMQNQFDIAFSLKSSWQKKEVDCFVIRCITEKTNIETKGGDVKGGWTGHVYSLQNVPWGKFVENMSNITATPFQFVDETGIPRNMKIDISMNVDWSNLATVNNSLKPYGLYIAKEKKLLDCIILEDSAD